MIFTLPRAAFRDAVAASAAVAPNDASMESLKCVVIETDMETTVTIIGSDTYTTVVTKLEGDIEQRGACMVNAKALRDVVASLPESNADVRVFVEDSKLKMTSGKSKRDVPCLSSDSYPMLAKDPPTLVKMAGASLLRAFSIVEHAACDDAAKPNYSGVNLICGDGKIVAQATDAHRIAHVEVPCDVGTFSCLIPTRGAAAMKRALADLMGDAEIGGNDTHASLRCGNTITTVKLTGETFPLVLKFIPEKCDHEASVCRSILLDRLRRASVGSKQADKDHMREMDITFSDGGILLAASGVVANAKDEIDCDYAGPTICAGINPTYAIDALNAMDADEIRIGLVVKDGKIAGPLKFTPMVSNGSVFVVSPQVR